MTALKAVNKPLVNAEHKTFRSLLVELLNSRTQVEVAALLGVSQGHLSTYLSERRQSLPRRKRAREMAKRLGVNPEWLCAIINPFNKT